MCIINKMIDSESIGQTKYQNYIKVIYKLYKISFR